MTPRMHGALIALGSRPLDTVHGPFVAHRFYNLATGQPALAVTCGELSGTHPLPARMHSSCVTSEALGACDCDCAEQLDRALAAIAAAGRGTLFYLSQEGRGAGFAAKALDRMLVQGSENRLTTFEAYDRLGLARDHRRYEEVAWMRCLLGVTAPLEVLTNNPEKLEALSALGVPVAGHRRLAVPAQSFSRHYLSAKTEIGHLVDAHPGDVAVPPERVEPIAPEPVAGMAHGLRLASYLVPLRAPRPAWFRLDLFFDLVRRRERIVLRYGDHAEPLVRVYRERVLERFPLRHRPERSRWSQAVAAMIGAGGGCALVLPEDEPLAMRDAAFLASLLPERRARPLGDDMGRLARLLARLGVAVGPRSPLARGATEGASRAGAA